MRRSLHFLFSCIALATSLSSVGCKSKPDAPKATDGAASHLNTEKADKAPDQAEPDPQPAKVDAAHKPTEHDSEHPAPPEDDDELYEDDEGDEEIDD